MGSCSLPWTTTRPRPGTRISSKAWRLRCRSFQCWRLLRGRSSQQTIGEEVDRLVLVCHVEHGCEEASRQDVLTARFFAGARHRECAQFRVRTPFFVVERVNLCYTYVRFAGFFGTCQARGIHSWK